MKVKKEGLKTPYLSVWALMARISFYKIMMLLALMLIVEGGIFYYRRHTVYAAYGVSASHVEEIFYNNRMPMIFFLTLGLVFLILFWTQNRLWSRSGYIMGRLRLTEAEVFVVRTVYSGLCMALVFLLQVLIVFWMIWQCKTDVDLGGNAPQIYFFAFYGNSFLHCLLPMAEWGKWVRNLLFITACAMEAAGAGGKGRYAEPVCLYILSASWFESDMGINVFDVISVTVSVIVIVSVVWRQVSNDRRAGGLRKKLL